MTQAEQREDPLSGGPDALSVKKREIEKLLDQNRTLYAQKQELEKALDSILHSTSWTITQPLRTLSELSAKLFPLFRFSKTVLLMASGNNTVVTGSCIEINGSSPAVNLEPAPEELPACRGWVSVEGTLESSQSHAFFFLYYRTGPAFSDQQRFWITFVDGKPLRQLFYLPRGVKELRLDPFSVEGPVHLKNLAIRHHGTAQFFWRLFIRHFGTVLTNPSLFMSKLRKAFVIFREGGMTALRVRFFSDQITNNYQEWVKQYDTLTEKDFSLIREHIGAFERRPLFSVIMPVWNTPEKWLRASIESVRSQLYENWELCIADDCSADPHVRAVLEEYTKLDPRIKVLYRPVNGHISEASNSAMSLASGDYIALLDHDDELTPHALYMAAAELQLHPDAGILYSDEDKITGYGMRTNPYFKSSWNPLLLLAQNYVCHLTVIRRDLVLEAGGFRRETQGAQDWDLVLRVSGKISEEQIRHIPHILYHWRIIEGSTAQSTSFKPYVLQSQQRAVSEHLERRKIPASVEILEGIAQLRVHFDIPETQPLISIIIPTRDQSRYLKRCVDSIVDKSDYRNFEIIIVDNNSSEKETLAYFGTLSADSRFRILKDPSPFNFSRINNLAAGEARGDFLAFLNNDLEVINPAWLSELLSHAAQADVGAAGARLLYPNDLIQHAGIILGIGGVAGHNHKGRRRASPGYFNRAILPQNFSAVTAACLLMRKTIFDEIHGFDEGLSIAFNDVDLCLRIGEAGYRIVYTPYAELYHFESLSRGYENTPEKFARFEAEIEKMKKRWGKKLLNDPCYNPNLTLLTEDFAFAFPPRAVKPWKG